MVDRKEGIKLRQLANELSRERGIGRLLGRVIRQFGGQVLTSQQAEEIRRIANRGAKAELYHLLTKGEGKGKPHYSGRMDHNSWERKPRQNRPRGDGRISRLRTRSYKPLRLDSRDRESFWMKDEDGVK